MVELSEPTIELAARLLSQVSYNESLAAVVMSPTAGDTEYAVQNLKKAIGLMYVRDIDNLADLFSMRGQPAIGYIDLDALKKWVAKAFGDEELAQAIGDVLAQSDSYIERIEPIKELLLHRLQQCEEVLGKEVAPAV